MGTVERRVAHLDGVALLAAARTLIDPHDAVHGDLARGTVEHDSAQTIINPTISPITITDIRQIRGRHRHVANRRPLPAIPYDRPAEVVSHRVHGRDGMAVAVEGHAIGHENGAIGHAVPIKRHDAPGRREGAVGRQGEFSQIVRDRQTSLLAGLRMKNHPVEIEGWCHHRNRRAVRDGSRSAIAPEQGRDRDQQNPSHSSLPVWQTNGETDMATQYPTLPPPPPDRNFPGATQGKSGPTNAAATRRGGIQPPPGV